MTFILSFIFGAVLAAVMPVVAFLAIVALAGAVSIGIAVAQGSVLLLPLLRVSGEAACAQLGYITGVAGLALVVRLRSTSPGEGSGRGDTDGR